MYLPLYHCNYLRASCIRRYHDMFHSCCVHNCFVCNGQWTNCSYACTSLPKRDCINSVLRKRRRILEIEVLVSKKRHREFPILHETEYGPAFSSSRENDSHFRYLSKCLTKSSPVHWFRFGSWFNTLHIVRLDNVSSAINTYTEF